MKSPFPGMDPYLEETWGDVQARLATYTSDQLNPQLPRDLRARIEVSTVVEADDPNDPEVVTYYPDVQVHTTVAARGSQARRNGLLAVAEPLVVDRPREPRTQRSVHIKTVRGGRLVTAIEFLSPANKIGTAGREQYKAKQADILDAAASLVEVDLVRAGRHVLAVRLTGIPQRHRSGYKAVVVRGWAPERAEVYPLPLRESLSAIRIPLRKTDADVRLDLQKLIDQAYANGGYDSIDYRARLLPDLDRADTAWADKLLKVAGKR